MKKRISLLLLAVLAVTSVLASSCGLAGSGESEEPVTLEQFVEGNEDVRETIAGAMEDSNVLVEIQGNDIIYSFDLSSVEGYTEEIAKSDLVLNALESVLDEGGSVFGNLAKDLEDATGILGIRATLNYTWGDEVLATRTYTSQDAVDDSEDADPEDAEEGSEDAAD